MDGFLHILVFVDIQYQDDFLFYVPSFTSIWGCVAFLEELNCKNSPWEEELIGDAAFVHLGSQ